MNKTKRCPWLNLNNPLYVAYHDEEWGRPVHDDRVHFEMLTLEGAQAGLSWQTILRKRERYREVFDNFDVCLVAGYSEKKIEELMQDPGIVRNRLKIKSTIGNAKAFIRLQESEGSFDSFIWSYFENKPIINSFNSISEYPSSTPLSLRISKDLKKRGFKFVGETIVYAYMQAAGMTQDHSTDCFLHAKSFR